MNVTNEKLLGGRKTGFVKVNTEENVGESNFVIYGQTHGKSGGSNCCVCVRLSN